MRTMAIAFGMTAIVQVATRVSYPAEEGTPQN
jgi:hypothetical protein